MVVQRVEIIPLEVVLRNIATGSLCRQTPIVQGTASSILALLDLYYKDDSRWGTPCSPMRRVQPARVLQDEARLSAIEQLARRVNAVVAALLRKPSTCNWWISSSKWVSTHAGGTLLLADEISPDTCQSLGSPKDNGDVDDRILG